MKQFQTYQCEALEGKSKLSRRKMLFGFGFGVIVGGILVKDRNISPDCVFPDNSVLHQFTQALSPESVCGAIISPKKKEVSNALQSEKVNTSWHLLLEKCIGKEPIIQDEEYEYWLTNIPGNILRIHKKTVELSLLEKGKDGTYQVVHKVVFPASP